MQCLKNYGFIKQDNEKLGIIKYIKTMDSTTPTEFWYIVFHKGERIYQTYKITNISDIDYNLGVFFEWQKAINEKCKELKWL